MKRKILSLAVGLLVVSAGAFGALQLGLAGTADAKADGTTYASVTKLTGQSYNGQVEGIEVSSTGIVEWESMPDNVDGVTVTLEAKNDGAWHDFASKTFDDVPSDGNSDYSYGTVEGDLIANTNFTPGHFSEGDDGDTRKEYVPIRVTVAVTAEDGSTCEFSEVHKVRTVVSNLADPNAGGNTTIGGEVHMDDSGADCETC